MEDKKEYEERRSRSDSPNDRVGQSEDLMNKIILFFMALIQALNGLEEFTNNRVRKGLLENLAQSCLAESCLAESCLAQSCSPLISAHLPHGHYNVGAVSIQDLKIFLITLLRLTFETPELEAPKKPKDRRNRISHSNDAKAITSHDFRRKRYGSRNNRLGSTSKNFRKFNTGNRVHNVTYNMTVGGSAQVAVGDNARIVNNYCTCAKQDEKTVSSTLEGGAGLTSYLKKFYRTGKRALLLPLPWMEGDQFHIENIYMQTQIAEMYTKHDLPPERIFKAETDAKNIRCILIEGEPRIGKSALCKKMAYDWSMKNTPESWPTFAAVLSLKCVEFHPGLRDLWDAIEMQIFSDDLKKRKDEIFTYIKTNQKKVLLILDGYDEIPDESAESMKQSIKRLIHGQLLPYCHLIVTSRPGKAAEIRNHFDRKLEIKGFEGEDSFKFIQRFSSLPSAPQTAEATILSIKKSDALKDLVRSPFNTSILCLVHQENEDAASLAFGTCCEEIVFSVIKRYYLEKLQKEIKDDVLKAESHAYIDLLGKMAFRKIKENKDGIDEKELALIPGIARSQLNGFLVNRKLYNKIRPVSHYHFPHNSIQDYLAFHYVKGSFKRFDGREIYSILSFKDFASFMRSLKLMYAQFETRIAPKYLAWPEILARNMVCRFILYCFLYSIYITIKMITCFISLVMKVVSVIR